VQSSIRVALDILEREITRRALRGIRLQAVDDRWIRILLLEEDRVLWLGHLAGHGYFLSSEHDQQPAAYFALDSQGITSVLGPPPTAVLGADLVEHLSEAEPDAEKLGAILGQIPASARGIDILATLARLMAFREAIDSLRALIDSHADESDFEGLLARNPWLVGSQYTEVVARQWNFWHSKPDLVLISSLGRIEVVELKRPDTALLVNDMRVRAWRASESLSQAQAQARKYLRTMDENGTSSAAS
jgi:hypothetical protein